MCLCHVCLDMLLCSVVFSVQVSCVCLQWQLFVICWVVNKWWNCDSYSPSENTHVLLHDMLWAFALVCVVVSIVLLGIYRGAPSHSVLSSTHVGRFSTCIVWWAPPPLPLMCAYSLLRNCTPGPHVVQIVISMLVVGLLCHVSFLPLLLHNLLISHC